GGQDVFPDRMLEIHLSDAATQIALLLDRHKRAVRRQQPLTEFRPGDLHFGSTLNRPFNRQTCPTQQLLLVFVRQNSGSLHEGILRVPGKNSNGESVRGSAKKSSAPSGTSSGRMGKYLP